MDKQDLSQHIHQDWEVWMELEVLQYICDYEISTICSDALKIPHSTNPQ